MPIDLTKLDQLTVNIGDMALKRRVKQIVFALDPHPEDKILDCGCGDGLYEKIIRSLGAFRLIGFDLNEYSLRLACAHSNGFYLRGNACYLPFKDNAFDKIFSSEVLEHIDDDLCVLKEINRVLMPGGSLIITVPNHNYPFLWDPLNKAMEALTRSHIRRGLFAGIWNMHLRLYNEDEIADLARKAGFNIKSVELLTHYCFPFNHVILYALKKVLDSGVLPESFANTADKFSANKHKQSRLIKAGYSFLNSFDKLNDRFAGYKSSVSILLEAVKKYA